MPPENQGSRVALVVTAIPPEAEAVIRHLTDLHDEVVQGSIFQRGVFAGQSQRWQVGVVDGSKGNVTTGILCIQAIHHFRPEIVVFVGVAGGIKNVQVGDVVVADRIIYYELAKASEAKQHRYEPYRARHALAEFASALAETMDWRRVKSPPGDPPQGWSKSPKTLLAAIASGEKVIASRKSELYQDIAANLGQCVAVDMEGYGVCEAARRTDVDWLVVRGISDLLDDKSAVDDDRRQAFAACQASAVAFELLNQLPVQVERTVKGMVEQLARQHLEYTRTHKTLTGQELTQAENLLKVSPVGTELKEFIQASRQTEDRRRRNRMIARIALFITLTLLLGIAAISWLGERLAKIELKGKKQELEGLNQELETKKSDVEKANKKLTDIKEHLENLLNVIITPNDPKFEKEYATGLEAFAYLEKEQIAALFSWKTFFLDKYGLLLMKAGKIPDAEKVFDDASKRPEKSGKTGEAYARLAQARFSRGPIEEALEPQQRAVKRFTEAAFKKSAKDAALTLEELEELVKNKDKHIKDVTLLNSGDPELTLEGTITEDDLKLKRLREFHQEQKRDQGNNPRYKIYAVKMQKGKKYEFDLVAKQFDPLLRIENGMKELIEEKDDNEVGFDKNKIFDPKTSDLNSRITVDCPWTGYFRVIVAESDNPGFRRREPATYQLRIKAVEGVKTSKKPSN